MGFSIYQLDGGESCAMWRLSMSGIRARPINQPDLAELDFFYRHINYKSYINSCLLPADLHKLKLDLPLSRLHLLYVTDSDDNLLKKLHL
jgi:hypothetical protein